MNVVMVMKQISIRLDEELLAEIEAEKDRLGVSRNLVISRRIGKLPPLYSVDRETGTLTVIPESSKKIANITPRGGSPERGGDIPLPRGGKAQDTVPVVYKPRAMGITDLAVGSRYTCDSSAVGRPHKMLHARWLKEVASMESCDVISSSAEVLNEMTEAAKGDADVAATLHLAGVKLDKEILERWGLDGELAPKVPTQELREIAAGNFPVPTKISSGQDTSKEGADICGYKEFNPTDGEDYMCGLDKHGPKVKHGEWVKI